MIENQLLAYLLADAPLVALLGHATAIYPQILPDEVATPAITYDFIGGTPAINVGGAATTLATSVLTLSIFAEDYTKIRAIEAELTRLLHGFSGLVGGVRVSGARLKVVARDYETEARLRRSIATITFTERV